MAVTYTFTKQRNTGRTHFKKGHIPWNRGIEIDREKFPTFGHFQKHSEKSKRVMREIKKKNPPLTWLGKKLSEEHKNKIRIKHLGKILSKDHKRKISEGVKEHLPSTAFKKGRLSWNKEKKGIQTAWNKGKKTSLEIIERLRRSHLGKIPWNKNKKLHYMVWNKGKKYYQIMGKKNGNWKGGITPENELIRKSNQYNQWRLLVYKRDNYTCQDCGEKHIEIVAHHIKFFNEFETLRFKVDNGRTLCRPCHTKLHKMGGVSSLL